MLGLLKEGTGVAFTVLNKLGVTAEEFEKLIQERIGTGEPTQLTPCLLYTSPEPLRGSAASSHIERNLQRLVGRRHKKVGGTLWSRK